MKLPIFKRILREDLQDAPDWVGKLIYPINQVFETVYNTLNRNITFQDNILSFSRSVTFRTLSTYTSGDFTTISFAIPDYFKVKVTGLWTISGGPTSAAVTGLSGLYVHWQEVDRAVQIDWIGGLTDDTEYTFTWMVI